ncbi:MAG: PD-(D/E)XK nuclease domain-containing protein, partial [Bacteroidales bacterium]|nr:PD-(D/E)XK nuclease domain-containing protein [Bacteroidales bacterium]
FYSQAEYHTSDGRIDLLIETPRYRYVMEFKLDGTAEEALQQIRDKDYPLQFRQDDKQTFLVGVNFSKKTRTIDRWLVGG